MFISKICFTFVKSNKNALLGTNFSCMETKDRIKLIMEDQHMTQQYFADFLEQSPATLSSIFNGRTRPTLNIVESIKQKIPDINTDWLLWGTGDMYISHHAETTVPSSLPTEGPQESFFNFDSPTPPSSNSSTKPTADSLFPQGVKSTHPELVRGEIKIVDKEPRKVTEIRVYYDDQTYESFVPAKK